MLRVEGLEVVYPNGTRALERADLGFSTGAFTVLLGASGAGKSTLLRSLNGLVRPTSGRVTAAVGDIANARRLRAHRRKTGMIFQQHQLIGRLTVLDNVLMGRLGFHSQLRTLLPFAAAEKREALQAIERVGLIQYALRRADQLSGGQQQRVGIARALVQKPSLVLADEPVASLDPATADRVLGLLHSICKADAIAAVVSLHQLDFARRYADRIIGLAGGRVVFDGPPSQLGRKEVVSIYRDIAPNAVEQHDEPEFHPKTGTYA
ncbi:MAG: phosphonate ABC transporter ATP-binding protein [Xanthobacteraceae bacterium]|nr:phosphonate ABC transporter ATP-binding protein [Xanthobacteraceae bacterium]